MHIKRLFIVLAAGLGLTLTALWLLAGPGRAAPAAPTIRCVAPGGTGCAGPCQGVCHASIQAAVDVAVPGDEIRIAAGVYTGVQARGGMTQVVYISQTVAIRGGYTTTDWITPDPAANPTTLDAQEQGRVVSIIGDISLTLEGLRITGGSTDYGGGIYEMNAHPVISGCQVYSNTASNGGGGLYLYPGANAMLMGNSIYSNTTAAGLGGGVYIYASDDIALTDNAIYSNTARGGGGIYLGDSAGATLAGNVIYSNRATIYDGGGIYVSASRHVTLVRNRVYQNTAYGGGGISLGGSDDATLIGNQVCSNTATYNAGGLYFSQSYTAALTGNYILGNAAGGQGGGILFAGSRAVTLTNNVVAENRITGSGRGVGIYMENSEARLLHTTLARNSGGDGSGVHVTAWGDGHSIAALTNTILVSHAVGITVTVGNTATLEGTLWHGNTTANWGGAGTVNHSHDHTSDPRFAADGYHLLEGSAAIDGGIPAGVVTDIDGESRVGAPDLGADEYALQVYLPLVMRNY
jgi:parallel beta-helix repeat protein